MSITDRTPKTAPSPNRRAATAAGLAAVGLWATLASLTTLARDIPPFQLAAMTFAVGTLVGLGWAAMRRQALSELRRVPAGAWLLGVYGLFAFHACYFLALRFAPPIEASLIVYLWPLLIVIMAGALPARLGGKRLRVGHCIGALLGLAGAVLILLGNGQVRLSDASVLGYALAGAAALIWSSYSVASRLYSAVPSIAVIGSCAVTAILSLACHLVLESTTWPAEVAGWLAIAGLGLGPVGLAFYLWDEGMKHGNIVLLGVASYATPLLSTCLLAALGLGRLGLEVGLAAVLIALGAAIASRADR